MAVLLKTASVRVSFIQIMQVRVQDKGKSVWKSRYIGDVSGRCTATSSYDIYMVDTPKENNGEDQKDATEDNPLEKQPKRCRSKFRHSKNSDIGTRDNSTPDDAEDENNPAQPSSEQAGR